MNTGLKNISAFKTPADNAFLTIAKNLFIFIPAIIYFSLVNKYALNIPSQDDYDAILGFLIKYKNAHGLETVRLLLSQHNEHRILSSRIVYVLYDYIFGGINFRSIIFIGNFQLLLIFIILVAFIKKCLPGYWVITSFITGLCLFDPNSWENAGFAMGCMQNFGIIFLFMASLYFYSLTDKKFLFPAAALQILCIYSSGNGIIAGAFIVLSALLLKDRLKIIVSFVSFLIFSPLYFVGYISPPPHQSIGFTNTMKYFLHLVSAHIYMESMLLSIIAGALLLIIFIIILPVYKRTQLKKTVVPFICLSGFLWATMGTIALFRSNLGGPVYCSRYLIYPHFLFAVIFIFMLLKLNGKIIIWPVIIVSGLFILRFYKEDVSGGIYGFEFLKKTLKSNDYYYPDKNGAKVIADKACLLNIYCIENNR